MSIERMEPGKVYKLACGMVVQYRRHDDWTWFGTVLGGGNLDPVGLFRDGHSISFYIDLHSVHPDYKPIKEITP